MRKLFYTIFIVGILSTSFIYADNCYRCSNITKNENICYECLNNCNENCNEKRSNNCNEKRSKMMENVLKIINVKINVKILIKDMIIIVVIKEDVIEILKVLTISS